MTAPTPSNARFKPTGTKGSGRTYDRHSIVLRLCNGVIVALCNFGPPTCQPYCPFVNGNVILVVFL